MNYKKVLGAASAALMIAIAILILTPGAGAQGKYKTLHKFKGSDGNYPQWNLTFDATGNLYGAACGGGAHGNGVVFQLAPNSDGSWRESALHVFTGGADGGCPNGGLVFDAAGNLYGASWSGGAYGGGTVFELTPNPDKTWTESVLYDFTGGLDGSVPAAPLIIDAQGDLYGTALYGGTGWGVVFKLTPNSGGTWTQSVLYTFAGTPDLGHAEGNVIFDAAGNLYGTAYEGGSAKCGGGCGGVFKLAPSQNGTWTESVLHRFNGADGADPQGGLVFDANGDLYGATVWSGHFGGCGNNRCGTIFELTPNPDGTWAIHFPHRFTGGKDGGSSVGNLAFDATGNLYGTGHLGGAYGYGVVFKLAPKPTGGWKETVLHAFKDTPGANPQDGVIFDAAGNLYSTTGGDGSKTFGSVFEIKP